MELTGELLQPILQPLGIYAILGVLVFVLLYFLRDTIKSFKESYDKNTQAMLEQAQTNVQTKAAIEKLTDRVDVNNRMIDRFDDFLRNRDNNK